MQKWDYEEQPFFPWKLGLCPNFQGKNGPQARQDNYEWMSEFKEN